MVRSHSQKTIKKNNVYIPPLNINGINHLSTNTPYKNIPNNTDIIHQTLINYARQKHVVY
jgi:hypothetical protein